MRKQIANIITASRILSSICLLLCPVFSISFYIIYIYCGITDMADGAIARRTKSDSKLGAILDTVADSVFVAVCFVKILPTMQFPVWLWIWIIIIAIIKIGNFVWVLICNKKLISLHTILNKATGFLLFLFPLTLSFIEPVYSSVAVCLIATLSAINEMWHIRMGKEGVYRLLHSCQHNRRIDSKSYQRITIIDSTHLLWKIILWNYSLYLFAFSIKSESLTGFGTAI